MKVNAFQKKKVRSISLAQDVPQDTKRENITPKRQRIQLICACPKQCRLSAKAGSKVQQTLTIGGRSVGTMRSRSRSEMTLCPSSDDLSLRSLSARSASQVNMSTCPWRIEVSAAASSARCALCLTWVQSRQSSVSLFWSILQPYLPSLRQRTIASRRNWPAKRQEYWKWRGTTTMHHQMMQL